MPTANVKPLAAAPPPLHSIALTIAVLVVCLFCLPSLETIDEVATIKTFSTPVLEGGFLSPLALGFIRLSFAAFIIAVTVSRLMWGGHIKHPTYKPQSKLSPASITMRGIRVLAPFTWWCWVLLGLSFFLSGSASALVGAGRTDLITPWHLRLGLLAFETSAPLSFLAATVVKYALWPHALKTRGPGGTVAFRSFSGLATHNANAAMVLTEVSLLGGMPVKMSHVAVAPLFGIAYIVFSWAMSGRWTPGRGPQFLYFFFDTTLGWTTSLAILALLAIQLIFYALFSLVDDALENLKGGFLTHILGIVLACFFVCRFRD